MATLPETWERLINLGSQTITLRKFTAQSYDEDWDQGTATYYEYQIPGRVKYNPSEREITNLGENLKLDALITIRKKDIDELSLFIAPQDRFVINSKVYSIIKIRPVVVAGVEVGIQVGVKEVF